jgi:peptide/nickel transport system ATP-binding protein
MNEPVLVVQNLRVEFPARRTTYIAASDISFDIKRREILGIVGESGAGKSTIASAIIGLIDPPGRIADGEIRLMGLRIDNLPAERMRRIRGKHIGVVLQDPLTSLNPVLRIGTQLIETIVTHTPLRGRAARNRAISLLEEVGIPAADVRLDNYPHQFSGGMRQRVVLALALAADPELLIVDEPTTSLDVSTQAQIIALFKQVSRQHGMALLLITHDMGVIAEAADRVAVLYAGRVVEVGPVRDVLKAPQHPYTRGLMHCVPQMHSKRDRLVQIPGAMPRVTGLVSECDFHPRCSQAFLRCRTERPRPVSRGNSEVVCWLYEQQVASPAEP